MMKHHKETWGGKHLFTVLHRKSGQELKQDRILEGGADADVRVPAYWLAPHGWLSLLSFRTQDHQTRGGSIHNRWALPHQSF